MVPLLTHCTYPNTVSIGRQIATHVEKLKARAIERRQHKIKKLEKKNLKNSNELSMIQKPKEDVVQIESKQEAIDEFVDEQYVTQFQLYWFVHNNVFTG